jgi:hypothetical protein
MKKITIIIRSQRSLCMAEEKGLVASIGQSTMYKLEDRTEIETRNIFLHRASVGEASGL